MTALEAEVGELRELVDGQESWSHRKRLHELEGEKQTATAVVEALQALREVRIARSTRLREWGSFAVAFTALLLVLWPHL